jgi:hypothetical protein
VAAAAAADTAVAAGATARTNRTTVGELIRTPAGIFRLTSPEMGFYIRSQLYP